MINNNLASVVTPMEFASSSSDDEQGQKIRIPKNNRRKRIKVVYLDDDQTNTNEPTNTTLAFEAPTENGMKEKNNLMSMFVGEKSTFINTIDHHIKRALNETNADDWFTTHIVPYSKADEMYLDQNGRFEEMGKIVDYLAEIGNYIANQSQHKTNFIFDSANIFITTYDLYAGTKDLDPAADSEFVDCFPPLITEDRERMLSLCREGSIPSDIVESFFYFCNRYHQHLKNTGVIENDCNIFIMSNKELHPSANQLAMSILNQDNEDDWENNKTALRSHLGFMDHTQNDNISSVDVLLLFRMILEKAPNITTMDEALRVATQKDHIAQKNNDEKGYSLNHFTTVSIYKNLKEVFVFDSSYSGKPQPIHSLTCKEALTYFQLEHEKAKRAEGVKWKEFKPYIYTAFPQQTNAIDCGVYAAYSALCHAYGLKPALSSRFKKEIGRTNTFSDTFTTALRMAMFAVAYFTECFLKSDAKSECDSLQINNNNNNNK